MDVRKCCRLWSLQALFVLLFLLSRVSGDSNHDVTKAPKDRKATEIQCTPGLNMPGYTLPHGDIIREYGAPLDIVCTLNNATLLKEGTNAVKKLTYSIDSTPIPMDYIQVVNSSSIKLHIDTPPKATGANYMCLKDHGVVCMNLVTVGTKPQTVTDFECMGHNYDNLTCTWTPPENYVKTDYNLTYTFAGRASRNYYNNCPWMVYPTENSPNNKIACMWNLTSSPQYRQVQETYVFTLKMENVFGKNEINKTFLHYQRVLSNPPENLTVLSTTTNSIYLSWTVPYSMQVFPPGVQHRVIYQCEYGLKEWHFGGLLPPTLGQAEVRFNLTGLKYAHAIYDIRVAIRSAAALQHDESMWSRNSSINVRTSSKVPDVPPETNIGSFEIAQASNNLQVREAYIYWKQIREEQKNGPDFHYLVSVEGNDTRIPDRNSTNAYAKFENLSISKTYTFNVWSTNEDGRSAKMSSVTIPMQIARVSEPMSFAKVEFEEGEYELTWEPPKLSSGQVLANYTIFWCNNDKDRPYQCNGRLNWKIVPKDRTVYNATVPKSKIYQFAIAANTQNSSSGMLWAACTIIHNKNTGKMKNVWINRLGSTFIEVGWKLDCSDRIGSVKGFIIYYCPILSPLQTECNGPQKNVTFYGDTTVLGGNITNLRPYTTYMLTVSVINKHITVSQQSDPLFNTTLEAAPSTPPLNLEVVNVTNSTITLSWTPPKEINGILNYYILRCNNISIKLNNPKSNITLENLSSYEKYHISIKACTTMCSNESKAINVTTHMGYPGKIRQPSVIFQNDSYITIDWEKPREARGNIDYYEVKMKQKHDRENKTVPIFNVTDHKYNIENCGDGAKYNTFYISVRAVNIIDGVPNDGPWSDELESYCRTPFNYLLSLVILGGIFAVIAVSLVVKRIYIRCKVMQDVKVILPPGLGPATLENDLSSWNSEKHLDIRDRDRLRHSSADEELLLTRMNEEKRHYSGDSSGCSSGHESVASSLESGTHISSSSDSGTEQADGNYCVLGVPDLGPKDESSYVPIQFGSAADEPYTTTLNLEEEEDDEISKVSPYITCETSSEASSPYILASDPYLLTGDPAAVKSINPGYISFAHGNEPESKPPANSGYVITGGCAKFGPDPSAAKFGNSANTAYVVAGVAADC